ncbi:7-deoxyloganetin glucosyltransferase-like [Populus nigra]|uniref:7-deoxyloganetin glucosyltransferase-like n=1 Tax=Populus nigra TaxID=3691 RepID=UPI002B278F14|nr:7-deoxyloganetin glucosyltransferase-like [Populus nigra]
MGSLPKSTKAHAVCVPYPAQGHITPMLKVAKLLHHKGFHITFVNSEYNHRRLLKSRGRNSLEVLPDFQFETIPDGLGDQIDADVTQDTSFLCDSTSKACLDPFRQLLTKLNSSNVVPPVTCIVADSGMSFALDVKEELQIPVVTFWTSSACGTLAYAHYKHLVERGYTPLKEESDLTNGYLETKIEWIPGMKDIRLKDLPTFIRTTDRNDVMLNFVIRVIDRASKASAALVNTFDDLDHDVLVALSSMFPPIYSVGPLNLLLDQTQNDYLASIGSSLWKEDTECLQWLDSKDPNSVVYVNFGSITVMNPQQLLEFSWGLANSKKNFLWIIRPDLVRGESAVLPPEFLEETRERGLMASWCAQEKVLKHSSIGGFLSHMGWNSTIESMSNAVPMLCWPFFSEQQTNCKFACVDWGVGMEIESDTNRDEVEKLVIELIDGEKGKEMKRKAMEWKSKAEATTGINGSSSMNFDKLVNDVLRFQKP